jgi:hypothetical protein
MPSGIKRSNSLKCCFGQECPDLRFDRVLAGSIEGFDAQVLFDPAKE